MPLSITNEEDKAVLQDAIQKTEDTSEDTINERIKTLLSELFEIAEREDETFRYRMLQVCKRNNLYFDNIQRIFFDEVARDYRTVDSALTELEKTYGSEDIKTINIYRAFAESLIAALSVSTPLVEFTPDDAENEFDIQTSEAYSRIVDLVQRHTAAGLMFVKALRIHYNQGALFAYNFYKQDPSYGTISKPKEVQKKEVPIADTFCASCFEPLDRGLPVDSIPLSADCLSCGYQGAPEVMQRVEYQDEVVQWENTPKGRVGYDIFGMTHVKAPLYARKQEDVGYLILRLEDNVAKFKKLYGEGIESGGGDTYRFERWARIPMEYFGTLPKDLTTARYGFFRPWYFYQLSYDDAQFLEEQFPNGVKVTKIGDDVLEAESENLDDCWTITFNPLSDFIHSEPPGNVSIPIQDAENDLYNLGLLSVGYGIPETFVHPKTVNLQKYKESMASPGMMTPAMPPGPDKSLADGFHTIKAATLSNEYTNFERTTQELGQFVTGAVPSLWGGTNTAGSNTATEYTESRARALQRLQLTWKMTSDFWQKLMFKCARQFANNIKEDEHFAVKKNGSYINVWVRKSELLGKIGQIEPEANEQLPQTWMQKRDFIMQLVQLQDPNIGAILLHPNNSELLKKITGMPEFYIPGEHDRNKQWAEYYLLSQQAPLGDRPSIEPDLDIDDHYAEMQVLKNILVSPTGIALYQSFPTGYTNCVLHYKAHELALQAKTMSMAGGKTPGEKPDSATKTSEG